MTATVRKFTFDTVFDANGRVLRAATGEKHVFTREELDAACAEARAHGERAATVLAEQAAAAACTDAARRFGGLLKNLAPERDALRREAAGLARAIGQALARRALAQHGETEVFGAIEDALELFREAPRVRIGVAAALADRLRPRFEALAAAAGFPGALIVEADGALRSGDAILDWGAGGIDVKGEATLARIDAIVERWLDAQADEDHQLDLFNA